MADTNNPIKYSDLVKPDSSISDLIKQLDQLSDAYMNALKNIKSEAISVKASLVGVSGATEEGRKTIQKTTSDTDKLIKAKRDLAFAEGENAKLLAVYKQAQKEANELNKLTVRLNQSAEGSYNRLSAQYSINKIFLNNMSIEEREATEEGRKLVEETNAIYQEMKRLQEVTGKTALNVGNYADANKGLRTILRENTQELTRMRLAGEEGSPAYNKLLKDTGELSDAMGDARQSIKMMASDTQKLDVVLGAASAAGGGISAFTGAMELFGSSSEDVQESQRKLQATIALTSGAQVVQNALQKQSALMIGISTVQTAALAKAEAYRRVIQMQGTQATIGATIAQKAFNLVASANPYVLLAVAVIAVVAAYVAFSDSTARAAENQNKLNELQKLHLETLEVESDRMKQISSERIAGYERELKVAQARNASFGETRAIEDKILNERRRANAEQRGYFATEVKDLEKNRDKLDQYRKSLIKLNELKASGTEKIVWDVELDGNIEKYKVDDAINLAQSKIDQYGKKVEIGMTIRNDQADIEADAKEQAAKRQQEARDAYKKEVDLVRKSEDAKTALINNSYTQQRAAANANISRQIADLNYQLSTENNLTQKGRAAINDTIVSLRKQLTNDLVDIANKEAADLRTIQRQNDDILLLSMEDGNEKRRLTLKSGYDRQIEDIQIRLETERGLTDEQQKKLKDQQLALRQQYATESMRLEDQIFIEEMQREADRIQLRLDATQENSQEQIDLKIALLKKQRSIELAQNNLLASDLRQSEKDINAKYDAETLKQTGEMNNARALMLFDQQQALNQSQFDLLENSEGRKTRFMLAAERDRLKKILELNKTAGVKMTDAQVATIQNTIDKIDKEIEQSSKDDKGKDIYELFGLNLSDKKKEAINESVSFATEQLESFMASRVAMADLAVEASNKEVDASKKRLDAEIEARNNGYASNVIQAQKDLDLARKTQEKALKDQAKAQKQQAAIQTLQQIGNLVTASALIWSQLGFPFAIPAIAIMWGSFAASKIKASQLSKQTQENKSESYGEGTIELLEGGSHASGNDIDLGTKQDGTKRRAEGGEFFAVINKRNSRKYRREIPDVINALNNGTFAQKYMNAYKGSEGISVNLHHDSPDLSDLKDDVRDIRDQNRRRTFVDGNGNVIEVYKNLKRKYKK